jgi:hypothetical protein
MFYLLLLYYPFLSFSGTVFGERAKRKEGMLMSHLQMKEITTKEEREERRHKVAAAGVLQKKKRKRTQYQGMRTWVTRR